MLRLPKLLPLTLVIMMFAASVLVHGMVPADTPIPIHFDAAGQANGFATGRLALYILPLITVAVFGLVRLLPMIDPRGDNIRRSGKALDTVTIATVVLLAAMHAMTLYAVTGHEMALSRIMPFATGVLLIVLGNVMGKIRHNYTFGLKTPWTLADPHIWDKTHRLGGWSMVIGGGLLIVGAGFEALNPVVVMIITIGSVLIPAAYSYWLWRGRAGTNGEGHGTPY